MSRDEVLERLKPLMSPAPSDWREKAEWRRDNREWLRLSGMVAVRVLSEHSDPRAYVKEALGCGDDMADLVVKGRADLALSEIVRLVGLDGFCEAVSGYMEWKSGRSAGVDNSVDNF